jgi:hypothetical protein
VSREPQTQRARTEGRRDSGGPPPSDAAAAPAEDTAPKERALSVKIDAAVLDQAMNTYWGVHQHTRWRDFVEDAISEYTARLERDHNGGKPYPPRPVDQLTRGRRPGS